LYLPVYSLLDLTNCNFYYEYRIKSNMCPCYSHLSCKSKYLVLLPFKMGQKSHLIFKIGLCLRCHHCYSLKSRCDKKSALSGLSCIIHNGYNSICTNMSFTQGKWLPLWKSILCHSWSKKHYKICWFCNWK